MGVCSPKFKKVQEYNLQFLLPGKPVSYILENDKYVSGGNPPKGFKLNSSSVLYWCTSTHSKVVFGSSLNAEAMEELVSGKHLPLGEAAANIPRAPDFQLETRGGSK